MKKPVSVNNETMKVLLLTLSTILIVSESRTGERIRLESERIILRLAVIGDIQCNKLCRGTAQRMSDHGE